jgi:hypothetical protein
LFLLSSDFFFQGNTKRPAWLWGNVKLKMRHTVFCNVNKSTPFDPRFLISYLFQSV